MYHLLTNRWQIREKPVAGMLWAAFCYMALVHLSFQREGFTGNQYTVILIDHLCPVMMHLYPDGSGLFQDVNFPIHRARWLTEVVDAYENDINQMLWPLQSSDLKQKKQLGKILDWRETMLSTTNIEANWWTILWRNGVHPSFTDPEACIICAKVRLSCSGRLSWPNTLLGHVILVWFSYHL